MSNNMCELCRNKEAGDVRFGVKICPECLKIYLKAMEGDQKAREQFNDTSFPDATPNAKRNIIALMIKLSAPPAESKNDSQNNAESGKKDNTSRSARDNSTKNHSNSDSTSSSTLDEILYDDIGKKIKGWAKWTFIIEAVCSVFGAIMSVFALESIDMFYIPLLWIVLGPIVAWVSSWLLYAFGELVDKTTMNEKHLRNIYQLMSKDK